VLGTALLILLLFLGSRLWAQETQLVTSFEENEPMRLVVPRDAEYEFTTQGVTEGKRALLIRFRPVRWPALFIRPPALWDLRSWGEIVLDITNPEGEAISFSVRVDDDLRADGTSYCRTGSGMLAPGATRSFAFPLNLTDPMLLGMRGLPVWPATTSLGSRGSWALDMSHIVQFQVFLSSPERVRSLIVDHIRWRTARPLENIVDEWGQYTGEDWSGKLHLDGEWATRREAEERELAEKPVLPERDEWGGWAAGPRLEDRGFFRTAKINGQWWLVTPGGRLFFSAGIDCVRPASPTFVTGREAMFSWLPPSDHPLARYYGWTTSTQGPVKEGRTYDFHSANLDRKYGPGFMDRWSGSALARLRSWGFNTVGNWSDSSVYSHGVPWVSTTHYSGNFRWITVGSSGMGDPFDPEFEKAVRSTLARTLQPALGDPYCVGHFVDNEMPWGSTATDAARYQAALAVAAVKSESLPARQEFIRLLQARYDTLAILNQAWGTKFETWQAVTAPPAPFTTAAQEDLGAFTRHFARQYFRTVRQAIRSIDPDHLYLGSRFHIYTPEVLEAAAEFVDVISFNIYQARIEPARWAFLNDLDKPAIIGEFHFGALDRGMFHTGLVAATDQESRAAMFKEYLRSVTDHPSFVGAHWFQYTDQPLTGRTLDGENYNIGFVTVTDASYPEMVRSAREVLTELYRRRAGSVGRPSRRLRSNTLGRAW